MKYIPYPLFNNHYYGGYQKYLSNFISGKKYSFNWKFFFFNIFWLGHHKMYAHLCAFITLFSIPLYLIGFHMSYGGTQQEFNYFLILFSLAYIFLSFTINSFYHEHCLNKIDYSNTDPLVKVKPYRYFLSVPISLIFLLCTSGVISILLTLWQNILRIMGIDIDFGTNIPTPTR